jgi:hypothetical protein
MTLADIYQNTPQYARETMAEALGRCGKSQLLNRGQFAERLVRLLKSGHGADEVCSDLTGADADLLSGTFSRMVERTQDPGSELQMLYADLAAALLEQSIAASRERMELEALASL